MSLRCLDDQGASVLAFDMLPEEWKALKSENRRRHHLRMPCCDGPVSLRRTPEGLQHFMHQAVSGDCVAARESEPQMRLKQAAATVARSLDWHATTDVWGRSGEDELWFADVVAERDGLRIAVCIEWSSQADEDLILRQERMARAGIECVWLFRGVGLPVTEALLAARLVEVAGHFRVELPRRYDRSASMSLETFLEAAFTRRMRFGEPIGDSVVASVLAGSTVCWHSECREETEIVTGIHFEVGTVARVLTLEQFDDFPELFEQIRPHIPRDGRVGAVKRRYSHTRQEEYLSNGCFACDRLMGRHYDHDATEDGEIIAEVPVLLTDRWRTLIDIAACTSHWRIVSESDAEPKV